MTFIFTTCFEALWEISIIDQDTPTLRFAGVPNVVNLSLVQILLSRNMATMGRCKYSRIVHSSTHYKRL